MSETVARTELTEKALVDGFRAGTLSVDRFHHREHVRTAWIYVRRFGVVGALERFPRDLRAFALARDKPNLYHETITWAYILLVGERIAARPSEDSWESFGGDNADLLDWNSSLLLRYYTRGRLFGEEARRCFLFPDPARSAGQG